MAGAKMEYTNFEGANLDLANMSGARIKAANLTFVSAVGTNLSHTLLASSDASFGDFRYANLTDVWWYQSYMWDADLRGADLSKPDDFRYAHACGPSEQMSCFIRAKFNSETVFPSSDFKPGDWNMIEVNEEN